MKQVRVRFAPSPTGELHIGGGRTALFNWLFARKNNGSFIIRIDDTDETRSRDEHLHGIFEAMRWLGMDWDEGPEAGGSYGPYYQSQRTNIYEKEIQRLLASGKAYFCFCSAEELSEGRKHARKEGASFICPGGCRNLSQKERDAFFEEGKKPVVRFLFPKEGETIVHDMIRGEVVFNNELMEDFVIRKSNGIPTYNFASVVDDNYMEMSHVIRAEEHLSNTPRQQKIASALDYNLPVYAHVPMILAPDRSKLSKRHGATSVQEFRDNGVLPEALINYLALLGWSPTGEDEIISLSRMIEEFALEKVIKTAAIYDIKKITWINGHYLRYCSPEKLAELSIPFLYKSGLVPEIPSSEQIEYIKLVTGALSDRIKTLDELGDNADYFFIDNYHVDPNGYKKILERKDAIPNIGMFANKLEQLDLFDRENVSKALNSLAEELQVSLGRINQPVRFALSGKTSGPDLVEMIYILGREKSISRLKATVQS